jgi:hypothetical protein
MKHAMSDERDLIAALEADLALIHTVTLDNHAMMIASMLVALHDGDHKKAVAFVKEWMAEQPAELWDTVLEWLEMFDDVENEPEPSGQDGIPL